MNRKKISKYLASEISLLPDRSKKFAIHAAMVFPNSYATAMSNLGFLSVFKAMHDFQGLFPQRFFYDIDGSLEENLSLSSFPVVAASISYEMDILNLIQMLRKYEIALDPQMRERQLIIVGGAAMMINPIPLSKIADAIFIGEGESFLGEIFRIVAENPMGISKKETILQKLDGISNIWLPAIRAQPPERIPSTDSIPTMSPIVSSFAAFPNMALIQIQRGCPFRCPFCVTPVIYNPALDFSKSQIFDQLDKWQNRIFRVGLIGSAIAEHPQLDDIWHELANRNLEIYTSSLRVDRISQSLLNMLKNSRQKTITLAPEVGSERLKKIIGKTWDSIRIVDIISQICPSVLKLYYIIGLPEESEEDVIAIAEEVKYIAHALKKTKISVSVNAFIPKKGTVWGKENMMSHEELQKRFSLLRKLLNSRKNIFLEMNYERKTRLQWILSCGGEEVAEILTAAPKAASFLKILDK